MDAIDFLRRRRSASPKLLTFPVPEGAELLEILDLASRTPDHGRLVPWRFVAMSGRGLAELARVVGEAFAADHPQADEAAVAAARERYDRGPMVVAVINRARAHHPSNPKIPEWEQTMTVGAVCMNLLHACHAYGYGAVWLSGWTVENPAVRAHLGLEAHERIAGFVHVGTQTERQDDRARPDVREITTVRA